VRCKIACIGVENFPKLEHYRFDVVPTRIDQNFDDSQYLSQVVDGLHSPLPGQHALVQSKRYWDAQDHPDKRCRQIRPERIKKSGHSCTEDCTATGDLGLIGT
jgi:hypothetical protein